jgi:uncharacterized alpha-E superfamily protein
LVSNLTRVSGGRRGETLRQAGLLNAELQFGRIDEILSTGLHDFLKTFLSRINDLGSGVSREFLVAEH